MIKIYYSIEIVSKLHKTYIYFGVTITILKTKIIYTKKPKYTFNKKNQSETDELVVIDFNNL